MRRLATETVDSFFTALKVGDVETLEKLAPELGSAQDGLGDVRSAIDPTFTSTVEDVSIDGNSATATVTISSGTDNDKTIRMVVPLQWKNDRWEIASSVTIEQRIDIVPISPQE